MEEKVENFDKKLEKYEDFNILMAKTVRYLIEGIWALMAMIPIQEYDRDMKSLFLLGGISSFLAISMYLGPYINVQEVGNTISVYTKLRYVPVSVRSIFHVRLGYLCRYCKVKLMAYLLLQTGIVLIALRTFSIWNLLYPLIWVGVASFLPGIWMIYPWNFNRVRGAGGRNYFTRIFTHGWK